MFSVQLEPSHETEMDGANRLLPVMGISQCPFMCIHCHLFLNRRGSTHDLARIFLRLRFKRRTRFFLHFARILVDCSSVSQSFNHWKPKGLPRPGLARPGQDAHLCEDKKMVGRKTKQRPRRSSLCAVRLSQRPVPLRAR